MNIRVLIVIVFFISRVCTITGTNCYRINTIRLHFVVKFNLVTNIVSIRHIPSFTKPSTMRETGNLP